MLAVVVLPTATALSGESADGFRYVLHSASPSPSRLSADPTTFDRVVERWIAQGPGQSLMFREENEQDPERATLALGERRMGLTVPHWDLDKSPGDKSGWTSYGKAIDYEVFDVEIERGEKDRPIAGSTASHYRLNASVVSKDERSMVPTRQTLESDLWVHEDKPFGFAPFATQGMYGDPRLSAALRERLGDLGLVVRVESRHTSQPIDENGEPLRDPREDGHVAWVSDLEPAPVPQIDLPRIDPTTFRELRRISREQSDSICKTVDAGKTPAVFRRRLDDEQLAAFMPAVREQCVSYRKRQGN
ncbi:MAG: hypothetical protein ACQER6_00640 [Pseudomonadota bacterium]